jgi:hypothetical protein
VVSRIAKHGIPKSRRYKSNEDEKILTMNSTKKNRPFSIKNLMTNVVIVILIIPSLLLCLMLPVILTNISAIINTILIEKLLHNLYQKKFFCYKSGKDTVIFMRQLLSDKLNLKKAETRMN